ncbi:MAG: nodulation protein NfeD [Muribaculaceae bacterium]|jgi:membrane-bound serine protease (ClpP class)|nr:nodulation protein NfeD [Muribaculaceae bacterium]
MNKIITLLLAVLCIGLSTAASGRKLVYILPIESEIDASAWQHTSRACDEARDLGADLLVVRLNTFGGALDDADRIRKSLVAMPMPTMAYVDHNAASAGAMIALACDTVYMAPGSSMGAVTVVGADGVPLPDKYQSYNRSILRATAELHGKNPDGSWRRDPEIAVRMVGPDSVVTFTAEEAVEAGYAEGVEPSLQAAIDALGFKNAEIRTFEPTVTDALIGFLSNAAVRALLVMLILGGIYMEMHTAGLGFAGAVSFVAAVLYFLPMLILGTLPGWIVILFIAGVVLIALEIFIIPGFGVCGVSGIASIFIALCAALLDTDNIAGVTTSQILTSCMVVVVGLLMAIGLVWYLTSSHGPRWVRRSSELMTELKVSDGFVGVDMSLAELVGSMAVTATMMRPAGKIVVNGNIYDAVAANGYIDEGESVRVVRFQNAQLYVEPLEIRI